MPLHHRSSASVLWSLSLMVAGCAAATPAPMHLSDDAPSIPAFDIPGTGVGFPQYPTLSPDGRVIVFAWGGDLWSVASTGGVATRLTVHPAEEWRSAFSPDGSMLAFESNRDGARNLYVMPVSRSGDVLVGGAARRLTSSDRPQTLSGFSRDGQFVLFSGMSEPTMYRQPRMHRVAITGASDGVNGVTGGSVSKLSDAFGSVPRPTADGGGMIFQRGSAPFDRPRYRGSGAYELWRMNTADQTFTRLTFNAANDFDGWPLPDGSVLFISSRDGQNNLYKMTAGGDSAGAPVPLTNFRPTDEQRSIGHGVRDLAVSADGGAAAFVVWDRLYLLNLADASAKPEPVALVGAGDETTLDVQRVALDKEITESAMSPDGKTLAVIARGEVFVRAMTEGYPTRRVTNSIGRERDLAWSPDGRVLYFSSDDPRLSSTGAGGDPDVFTTNLGKYAI